MKRRDMLLTVVTMICLAFMGSLSFSDTVYAKKLTTFRQAEKLAEKEVKHAVVVEADKDYEKGVLVYEIQLVKGKKEYDLKYRASDSKLISYGWEIQSRHITRGSGKLISVNRCRNLAEKQVPNGTINSVVRKFSDGVDVYKVKMQKGSKRYELKFHARTGKLLEYDWEFSAKKNQNRSKKYIGAEKAKQIALKEVKGGGTVVKVKFDREHGTPVYEVEIIKDEFEYDLEIHAKTGKVLSFDMDSVYD